MSGKAVFKVSGRAAAPEARKAASARGRIRRTMVAEFRQEAPLLESTFAAYAPIESGRLVDSVKAKGSFSGGGAQITISANPRDPESGYNYLDVTRFGHRGIIRPKRKRALSWNGRAVTVAFSRGSHPGADWVLEASQAVDADIDEMGARIGRVLSQVVL